VLPTLDRLAILRYQQIMVSKLLQPKNQKRGRPPTGLGTPVQVRLKDEFLAAVDDWRRNEPDLPNRPEAIRRLAEMGLKASAKRRKTDDK
jgi:hypothetical protein